MPSVRVIGPGRAGRSLARALAECEWTVAGVLGRGDDVRAAARGVDVLVIATPDGAVADVAAVVEPIDSMLVLHMSGSLTLDPVSHHPRYGSLHPLASLPDPETGMAALLDNCPVAVAGDPGVWDVATALGHIVDHRLEAEVDRVVQGLGRSAGTRFRQALLDEGVQFCGEHVAEQQVAAKD